MDRRQAIERYYACYRERDREGLQALTLEAAFKRDVDLAFQALVADPLVHLPTEKAAMMFAEMQAKALSDSLTRSAMRSLIGQLVEIALHDSPQ